MAKKRALKKGDGRIEFGRPLKGEVIIDDESAWKYRDELFMPKVNGEKKGRGLEPRNYHDDPPKMFAPPTEIEVISQSEWSDRLKELTRVQGYLSNIRLQGNNGGLIPSLDQGQVGYCWAHSTTQTIMMVRAAANLPYVPLSAYSIAATIKKGADEGGWCGLSAKFAREKGVASQAVWPQGDRNYRSHDNAATWKDAAGYKIVEDWVDLTRDVYDQQLSFAQLATCLLLGIPCAVDFNWWGHSVCALDLVEVEAGSFGIRILNSWSDSWGEKGTGVLRGSKAIPDSAVATRVVMAA